MIWASLFWRMRMVTHFEVIWHITKYGALVDFYFDARVKMVVANVEV